MSNLTTGQQIWFMLTPPSFVCIGAFAAALHRNTSPVSLNLVITEIPSGRPQPKVMSPLRVTDEGIHSRDRLL